MTDGFLIISSLTCCFRQERHYAINHFFDNITDAQRARVGEGYYCVLTSEGHWKWWNFKYSKKINPKREIWQESLLKGHLDTDLLASHTSRNLICEFPDIMPSIIAAWTDKVKAAENVGISFGLKRRNGGWSFSRLGKGSHTSRDSCEASCVSWERSLILQVINCHPKNFAVSINCHFIATHVCRELWRQFHKYRVVLLFSNNRRQLLPRKTNVDDWIKSFAFMAVFGWALKLHCSCSLELSAKSWATRLNLRSITVRAWWETTSSL